MADRRFLWPLASNVKLPKETDMDYTDAQKETMIHSGDVPKNKTSGELHTGGVAMPSNVASDKEILRALQIVNADTEKNLERLRERYDKLAEQQIELGAAYKELLGKAGHALEEGLVNKPPWLIIKSPPEGELSQGDTDQSQPNKQ